MKNFLGNGLMLNGILLTDSLDPLEIIKSNNVVGGDGFRLLGMSHLYRIMQKGGMVAAACVLLVTFIGILWVSNTQAVAEKKKNLIYVLGMIFAIASIVTIFTVAKDFLDMVFF